MHRATATLIFRRSKNIWAVQRLFGYTKLASTVRYPGMEVDDAIEVVEQAAAQGFHRSSDRFRATRKGTQSADSVEKRPWIMLLTSL